jgi:hypothetical protein
LYREGQVYTKQEGIAVFDHDWKSLAQGVAIPHGLYDLRLNIGYIHIGTSHDTSELEKQLICPILVLMPIAIARCIEKRLPLKKKRAKHLCFKPPDLSVGS